MGTVYDDSDPLPDVTYDLVPTGEHEAALAEVQRLREENARHAKVLTMALDRLKPGTLAYAYVEEVAAALDDKPRDA
jgi:hypothetical protein